MKQCVKKIWNIVSTVLVALIVILAIALVGVRIVGIKTYAVVSGSMEPVYPTGSLLYVKSADAQDLKVGDAITFMLDEDTVATHRVMEVVPDQEDPSVIRFRTKGDANEAEDGGLVYYKNVIGTPVFTIPYLGYVTSYIQHPPGTYIAIAGGAILLLLVFLPDLLFSDKQKKQKKGENEGKYTPKE